MACGELVFFFTQPRLRPARVCSPGLGEAAGGEGPARTVGLQLPDLGGPLRS